MITIVMSAVIHSERGRVWRALTDPAELVSWDPHRVATIDPSPPPGPPAAAPPDSAAEPMLPFAEISGEAPSLRWRYRLGPVQLVLHERAQAIVPYERLQVEHRLGSMRYDQTFSLAAAPGRPDRTRLGVKLVASNSIPVVGEVVDRFAVRRMASARVDDTLRWLQKWCERHPG